MRKTASEKATIKSKLEEIQEKIKKYEISYYEAHKHIEDMSISGLRNIFNGDSKNPSLENVLKIESFIKENYESDRVVEPKAEYATKFEDLVIKKLNDLEIKIEALSLKQEIMFEILKLAKASELEAFEKNMHRMKSN